MTNKEIEKEIAEVEASISLASMLESAETEAKLKRLKELYQKELRAKIEAEAETSPVLVQALDEEWNDSVSYTGNDNDPMIKRGMRIYAQRCIKKFVRLALLEDENRTEGSSNQ